MGEGIHKNSNQLFSFDIFFLCKLGTPGKNNKRKKELKERMERETTRTVIRCFNFFFFICTKGTLKKRVKRNKRRKKCERENKTSNRLFSFSFFHCFFYYYDSKRIKNIDYSNDFLIP